MTVKTYFDFLYDDYSIVTESKLLHDAVAANTGMCARLI